MLDTTAHQGLSWAHPATSGRSQTDQPSGIIPTSLMYCSGDYRAGLGEKQYLVLLHAHATHAGVTMVVFLLLGKIGDQGFGG